MAETFWEKWQHRIRDAWAVLTGRAYARMYPDHYDDWLAELLRPPANIEDA